MSTNLAAIDLFLRGAAAALLMFHIIHALCSRLPLQQRGLLTAFEASILAYLLCSDPAIDLVPAPLWFVALSLVFVAAPLLWLVVKLAFEDHFTWSSVKVISLTVACSMGWMATLGIGGVTVVAAQKVLLISFAAAALWTVVKDWRSDLVARRRQLRAWVTGGLAVAVLLVLSVELAYIRSAVPQFLMVLNLAGITSIAVALALAFARHPLDDWFRPGQPLNAALPASVHKDEPIHAEHFAGGDLAAAAPFIPNVSQPFIPRLTAAPPVLDRRAALRERLLQAMGEQRVYATESLSLAQLATKLDATPVQLREAINQHLGYRNFNDFLHHYRIDEASQRLLAQDLPILSIALDVGYGSIGPFNRAFKQIKGITPSEFRMQR